MFFCSRHLLIFTQKSRCQGRSSFQQFRDAAVQTSVEDQSGMKECSTRRRYPRSNSVVSILADQLAIHNRFRMGFDSKAAGDSQCASFVTIFIASLSNLHSESSSPFSSFFLQRKYRAPQTCQRLGNIAQIISAVNSKREGMFEGGPGLEDSTTTNRQYVQKLLVYLDEMERR